MPTWLPGFRLICPSILTIYFWCIRELNMNFVFSFISLKTQNNGILDFIHPKYMYWFFLKKQLCKQRTIKGEKSINYFFSFFDFLELVELESLKYPREDIISVLAWKRQVFASWQITSFVASSPMDNFHGTRNNILSQIIQFLEFRRDFNLDIIEIKERITWSLFRMFPIQWFLLSKVCFYFW